MGKWVEWLVFGFFASVIAAIVFIKAGANGKQMTGGQQTAEIVKAGGSATAAVANALEGGNA